jgi:hypothetical protein
MSSAGAAPRAAVPVSSARAEASRRNGAKSRGPKTPEGKARASRNALKHGMRAQKYLVLPEEDADEFAGLEAELVAELAPVGALQTVLARRVAVAAWRLARADRIEADLFAERSWGADPNPGLALIRDGNGTRSFETLLRYRGAAMAEFWRALKTLKALQAGPALEAHPVDVHPNARPTRPAGRPPLVHRPQPDEPERNPEPRLEHVSTEPPVGRRTPHEPAAPWLSNEPEPRQHAGSAPARPALVPNEPEHARMALAEHDMGKARKEVAEARRLVGETGYGRRRPEVEALEGEVP